MSHPAFLTGYSSAGVKLDVGEYSRERKSDFDVFSVKAKASTMERTVDRDLDLNWEAIR